MRTAIRTYAGGGDVFPTQMLDDRYFPRPEEQPVTTPVTDPVPQSSDVQPAPGQAGQATPAAPPPTQEAPPPPPPEQPAQGDAQPTSSGVPGVPAGLGPRAAIDTSGTKEQPFDHDADLPKVIPQEQAAWQVQRSVQGDNRILPSQPPEIVKPQDDARWPDYQRALAIYQSKNGDKKLQTRMRPQLDKLFAEINNDAKAQNKAAHDTYMGEQRQNLQKLDADYYKTLQTPNLNQLINEGLGKSAKEYDDVIQKGTPEQQQRAVTLRRMSPLDSMTNDEQRFVTRNILALNKQLDADDAAKVLTLIGSAVLPGKKGTNGFTGKAAANYRPDSTDLIGNRIISVPGFGLVRINPAMLKTLNDRRIEGYNAGLKYQQDIQKQRNDAKSSPNWWDKTIVSPSLDWLHRQVQ